MLLPAAVYDVTHDTYTSTIYLFLPAFQVGQQSGAGAGTPAACANPPEMKELSCQVSARKQKLCAPVDTRLVGSKSKGMTVNSHTSQYPKLIQARHKMQVKF